MTTAVAVHPTSLQLRFAWARAQLMEARRRQRHKDSLANRMAVAQCQDMVDAVLDDYLATAARGSAVR
jgi:hypothetical protein